MAEQGEEKPASDNRWSLKTIVEVAVGIAALVVAVAAIFVSIKANDISEQQATIAARQLQPVITASLSYLTSQGVATSQVMTVSNVGGPALGVNVDVATILDVQYFHGGASKTVEVPLQHYYTSITNSDRPTGVLATVQGDNENNTREIDLERASARLGSLDVELTQYARVTYHDELGNSDQDYVQVDPVTGASPVSQTAGKSAFAAEMPGQNGTVASVDLDTVTARSLLAFVVRQGG